MAQLIGEIQQGITGSCRKALCFLLDPLDVAPSPSEPSAADVATPREFVGCVRDTPHVVPASGQLKILSGLLALPNALFPLGVMVVVVILMRSDDDPRGVYYGLLRL